jgi:hypothetical protein
MPSAGFEQAVAQLLSFLEQPLTQTITQLEHALAGCESENVPRVVRDYGMNDRVLMAALLVRERLGRMNDVIHASAIVVVMPHILEPGEALHRPSLAAGNDPTRPFDIETDRRVAEFKLARWRGADAMRKRQLFKDLCSWRLSLRSVSDSSLFSGRNPSTSLRPRVRRRRGH